MLQNGFNPTPSFFLLVAAHKQIQTAIEDVQKQSLVSAYALAAKAFVKIEIKVNRAQVGRCLIACFDALVLAFGKQVQFQTIFGLQVNDQFIDAASGCLKNCVWRGPEIDFNVPLARCQAFACANVERHARPTPIGNLGSKGYKSFGTATGVDAGFFVVARYRLAVDIAWAVLAAHNVLVQGCSGPRFKGAQHFELFISNGIGMRIDGRLHGNGAK